MTEKEQKPLAEQLKEQQESDPQPRDTDPVEEAKKAEQQDENLGGDSSVGGGEPVKRVEQDDGTVNVEQAPPSPSVR